ncbi:MAG: cytochrome c biogenesis protein ResB [Chloroflexota bacterium]
MTSSRISPPPHAPTERPPLGTAFATRLDRANRRADRLLRVAGDPRLGIALLLLTGLANAAAAAIPDGATLLHSPIYLGLLGAVLLSGLASVAVRTPAAWREWRSPTGVVERPGDSQQRSASLPPLAVADATRVLQRAGYRVRRVGREKRWTLHAVRRGYARIAGIGSHLALVLVVLGVALGGALATETSFSLLPGEQARIGPAREGFTDAVRLDRFDAEFGTDGRPSRLDTQVTFLRDGEPAGSELLQVNRPGSFGGYLVHGWTYGPAVRLRVETLAGRPLLDNGVPLDGTDAGRPSGAADLPGTGLALGLSLVDADANTLGVTVAGAGGAIDTAVLAPGEPTRIGPLNVTLVRFDAYVTFLSRNDPGMGLVFGGSALLVTLLAVALWLPRRRLTLRATADGTRLVLVAERFDDPGPELARLERLLR